MYARNEDYWLVLDKIELGLFEIRKKHFRSGLTVALKHVRGSKEKARAEQDRIAQQAYGQ